MRCEPLIHTSAVLQKGPQIDVYRYIPPDSASRCAHHCYWIMSYDPFDDSRRPEARADLLRLRYYSPGTPRRRSRVSVPAVTEKLGAPGRIGGGMFIHTSLFGDDFMVWGDAIVDHSGPVHSM